MGHSCHANIDVTGSVRGMKNSDTGQNDRTVKSHGFIYNIDTFVVDKKIHMTCWPQNIVSAKHVLKEDQLRQRRIRL